MINVTELVTRRSRTRFLALFWVAVLIVPLPLESTGPAMAQSRGQAEQHMLNLRDADIRAFIEDVSMITGRTFIIDPRVNGKVTIVSREPVDQATILDVFMSTLAVHGFTAQATPSGAYKIIPQDIAAQQPGPVGEQGLSGASFVTEVIKLGYLDPASALAMIKPIIHRQGRAVANRGGEALIVVDTADNMRRVRQVLREMDRDTSEVRTVVLENISAQEMAEIVSDLAGDNAEDRAQRRGVQAVPVRSSNALILRGDAAALDRLVPVIEDLDARNESNNDLRVVYLKHASAETLVPLLEKVSASLLSPGAGAEGQGRVGRANIAFDAGTNALVIGADPEMQRTLLSVIDRLDVRRSQVLVEAIIVEVSDTAARDLGLQFVLSGAEGSSIPFTVTNFSSTAPNILAATGALVVGQEQSGDSDVLDDLRSAAIDSLLGVNGFATGFAGISDNGTLFGVIVNALSQDTDSNVLSTPSIMTMDNQPASIIVGQEIPITTGEALGANNTNPFRTIERQDVGVQLEVRPQINEGDSIQLFIRQEVSSIAGPVNEDFSELVTSKREIETTVMVDDGEIIVLGGLIEDNEQVRIDKVPLLGDIPIIGRAFRSEGRSKVRQNLMVFLRPTIVRSVGDVRNVTGRKYNYMRAEELLRSGKDDANIDRLMDQVIGGQIPAPADSDEAQ